MDLTELAKNNAWCPDPWSELSSDTDAHYKLCCWSQPLTNSVLSISPLEHWNSSEMREVRQAMIAGDRESLRKYCRDCHVLENSGAASRRTHRLRELNGNPDYLREMEKAVEQTTVFGDGRAPANYFHRVDLRVAGNLCNLRCIMCSAQSSSSIGEEMKRMGELPEQARTLVLPVVDMTAEKRKRFWTDLDEILPNTRCLYFAGGEPFLSESHYQVLDLAISKGLCDRIRLWYSTNLTRLKTSTGRAVIDYLNQFKNVRLSVSVDNLHKKNDYIRHGSDFPKFIENIQTIARQSPHVSIEPSTCVSILNILDLTDIHRFFKDLVGYHSFMNILTSPTSLRATYLPPELKVMALQRLSRYPELFKSPIRWLETPLEPGEMAQGFASFVHYIEYIDRARRTKFVDIFPEFNSYIA